MRGITKYILLFSGVLLSFLFLFSLRVSESVISLSIYIYIFVLNMVECVCVRLILMPCARTCFSVSSLWSDEHDVGL